MFAQDFIQKFFWEAIEFSINFLLYLIFSALRMPQSDAYQLNWERRLAMWTTVGFDASFNFEWTFLLYFMLKSSKHSFLGVVDTSKEFAACCTNKKSNLGFMKIIGLLREAVVSFLGYALL